MKLHPEFFARIVEVFGAEGAAWIDALPSLLAEAAERWGLQVGEPFEPLSYNYVAPAVRRGGETAVLKAGVPGAELRSEIAALRHYDGRGAVRLLESDADRGLLLLERVTPGTPLVALDDDEDATRIAAGVMRRLWRPPPAGHEFPAVGDWLRGFERHRARCERGSGPFPATLFARGEALAGELLETSGAPVVLHGDFHHWNILRGEREPWLAIDPKGVVGEPAYEAGALLRNPTPDYLRWPGIERVMARRVEILAETLGFERERIAGWGFAQAVLSACWSHEDHGAGWEPAIACAEILGRVLRKG
ncbi:MAG: phosphotransferase [Chloroflexi bacterium]|nr:phosphotransferase [Chloroflexota bacterium]